MSGQETGAGHLDSRDGPSGQGDAADAVTSLRFELPDWKGIDRALEVSVECSGDHGAEGLIGTWVFEGARPGPAVVNIDWLDGGDGALELLVEGGASPLAPSSSSRRSAVVRPEMTLRLACGGELLEVPFKVTSTEALEEYYQSSTHQDEYVVAHPFFLAFHKARLRELGKVFKKYIPPGSKVLDVGSGYSIFFLLGRDWDADITCCDLDAAAIDKMLGICPEFTWLVADATSLPFEDGSFGTVYAGEIIEHVPDPLLALAEWRRVLAPGGTLILTTPNRERLLARANRETMPVHPEHVREMSLPQARATLYASGFEVRDVRGIYLELMLNWYREAGRRVDMMISLFNRPEHERLYGPLMWAGRLAPSRAFDLVLICTRQ